jgi:hypothetical protein
MLTAEDCQRNADNCARLAETAPTEPAAARFRFLELSWLYMFRMKLRKKHPLPDLPVDTRQLSS